MKQILFGSVGSRPPLLRQGASFLLIGILLVLIDWMVFVLLTALGLYTPVANIVARVVGALVGFLANGLWTFSIRVSRHHLFRYVVLWLVMTALSTGLIGELTSHLSLHAAWLGKPLVETVLAAISFAVSRHWVYRSP
ncbi:GtrA family protein [Dyella psychrodurans]|uniref:GtrA family protein n=2 Tax=Dyella psychrodurans TaxID=1927960 RepID=A0A370WY62_9GAMM|nr:GtrA family protein [Dyella psychrodurans]